MYHFSLSAAPNRPNAAAPQKGTTFTVKVQVGMDPVSAKEIYIYSEGKKYQMVMLLFIFFYWVLF